MRETKYKLELVCDKCKKAVNTSTAVDTLEEATKVYNDALFNPFIGWCCKWKPYPVIYEIDGEGNKKHIRSTHPENHEAATTTSTEQE
jgi:hypothetical protein